MDIANPEGDLAPLVYGEDVILHFESLKESTDAVFSYKYIPPEDEDSGSSEIKDKLHALMTRADIDVDSDNNGSAGIFAKPDGTKKEDDIEDPKTDSDIKKYPGKVIPINVADLDGDYVIDFADGYNLFEGTEDSDDNEIGGGKKAHLVPMVLTLSEELSQDEVFFEFFYTSSKPEDVVREKMGELADGKTVYSYKAPAGFRIWKTNASARNKSSVTESGGDFIPSSGSSMSDSVKITAEQLGMRGNTCTLYIEATPGAENLPSNQRLVYVRVHSKKYIDGDWILDDAVRLYPCRLDLPDHAPSTGTEYAHCGYKNYWDIIGPKCVGFVVDGGDEIHGLEAGKTDKVPVFVSRAEGSGDKIKTRYFMIADKKYISHTI